MLKMFNERMRNEQGFTLVELLVVVLIIGILVMVAVPVFGQVTLNAAKKAHDANLRTIDGAIMMYYAEEGEYPTDLTELELYLEGADGTLKIPERLVEEKIFSESGYGISDNNKAMPGGNWGGYNDGEGVTAAGGEGTGGE